MRTKITIITVVVVALSVIALSYLYFDIPQQTAIVKYDKSGIKFDYFNSWKITDKTQDDITNLSFQKKKGSSVISIDVKALPISYQNYSFQQIVDAVRLNIESDNKDLSNTYSGQTQIGKTKYTVEQLLYETKNHEKQSSVMVGQSNGKLFVIEMGSKRSEFDLASNDLDAITDSIEIK